MKCIIKVGFLISYDYEYLFNSLPIVYDFVDEIVLAIDVNRNTWSGEKITIEDSFFEKIKFLDKKNKIVIYEDNFYVKELSPIENDTRERNLLSKKMGNDCWKLQIDVDEYFIDFRKVKKFLNKKHKYLLPNSSIINLRAKWITLFKQTENGYLYIDNDENFSFGTNSCNQHTFARDLSCITNDEYFTDFKAFHQSWARKPEEIFLKINNWGHKNDFDTNKFFELWLSLNEQNYQEVYDFHPFDSQKWKELKFMKCKNIAEFIDNFENQKKVSWYLKLINKIS